MIYIRSFVLCACFLAAVCTSSADSVVPPVAPAVIPKNDTKPAVVDIPVIQNATVATTVAPSIAANQTDKNTTVIITPANATNTSGNSTSSNATTAAPINKPITQAPPAVVITTVAPAVINVTEVPPKANVTPCMVLAPTAAPATAPVQVINERYFDGLSFIGGMVLAVGLLGIGRIAFKVYRNRSDSPNYLTL